MKLVFLSYSRDDMRLVEKVRGELADANVAIWIDREAIRGGDYWRRTIVEAIEKSDIFIIFLSQSSIQSDNCRRELELASEKNKSILPVVLDTIKVPASFEYPLAGLHQIDLSKNFSSGLRDLLAAVKGSPTIESESLSKSATAISPQQRTLGAVLGFIIGFLPLLAMVALTFISFDRLFDKNDMVPGILTMIVGPLLGVYLGIMRGALRGAFTAAFIGVIYGTLRGAMGHGLTEAIAEGVAGAVLGAPIGGLIGFVAIRFTSRK